VDAVGFQGGRALRWVGTAEKSSLSVEGVVEALSMPAVEVGQTVKIFFCCRP
jgi:hypothetical protein